MTRTAIVTGAAGGIGAAIADRLAADGYAVVGADVEAETSVTELREGAVAPAHMDVRSTGSIRSVVDAVVQRGTLQAVVNCAAVLIAATTAEIEDEALEAQLSVNLAGPIRLCRAAVPHLDAGASVVNVGSIAASAGGARGVGVYAATKAGLEGYTRALACELGPRGARANAVVPGFVHAPMSGMLRSAPGGEERFAKTVPLRRFAEPDEIAAVVGFLCSDDASYVNGEMIHVDGGRLAM